MPPVTSPGSPASRSTADERAARIRFRRAMALMLMTLVLPGSAQLVAGDRRVGRVALRIWVVLLAGGFTTLVVGALWHELFFWLASDTGALLALRVGLTLLAVAWAYLFVDAWRLGQPLTLSLPHRRAAIGVNGALCFSVAAALLFGAHLVGVQRHFILTMFGDGEATSAHAGRYNVLLLGGDSGAGRWGLRPDSMTVASIDADTGKTVLISLPRNMKNFPFAKGSVLRQQFPHGFDVDYLNGVNTWAMDHQALFPKSKHPGVDATIMAIEGITGLKINYWAMVNLRGFKDLVDAVGGVTLNVRQPIPVGGLGDDVTGYIKPGVRKLDGHDTLWFARARDDSDDYSRMARQKCVMNAMLQQISPQKAVRNFEKIADASSAMISTNIPAGEVDRFISLALKARGEKVATLSLVPPMINTAKPDVRLIHRKVAAAVDASEGKAPKRTANAGKAPAKAGQHKPSGSREVVTGGSLGSLSTGYAANEAEDLGAAC